MSVAAEIAVVAVTVTAEMVRSRLAELRAIEPGEPGPAA